MANFFYAKIFNVDNLFAGYSKQIKEGNIMAIKSDDPHAIEKLTDKLENAKKTVVYETSKRILP